jgi:endonuclease I
VASLATVGDNGTSSSLLKLKNMRGHVARTTYFYMQRYNLCHHKAYRSLSNISTQIPFLYPPAQ